MDFNPFVLYITNLFVKQNKSINKINTSISCFVKSSANGYKWTTKLVVKLAFHFAKAELNASHSLKLGNTVAKSNGFSQQ